MTSESATNVQKRYGAPAFLLLLAGCGDPLKHAQRIEEPRLLGVRMNRPQGEATLEPGRPGAFEVLFAGPDGPLEGRFAYRICEATETIRGVPTCLDAPFAEGTTALNGEAVPFEVPNSVAASQRLVLLGVACVEGEPYLGEQPLGYRCSGDDEPLRVSFDATTSGNVVNLNPDLSGLRVAIDGSDVPLADVAAEPSCGEGTHEVARGGSHLVELRVGNRAREPLSDTASAGAETLQLSHFSTRGTFERQFSFIDPRARGTRSSLEWRAPARRGAVKQYLVVRDERGGVSWASVHLCVR